MLEEIRHIGSLEPSMVWKDLKWAVAHFRDISKTAVVADRKRVIAARKKRPGEPCSPGRRKQKNLYS
ncbi:MAG: STAS/SEC14 domain-containing protein [Oceanidesulfovibrio sp.]